MSQSPMSRLRRRNTLEPMAVFNGPAGGGSGLAALARGITDFADSIDRTARQSERNQASEAGREAVTRDAEGNIVVKENPFRDDQARREFAAQQASRYVSEIEIDARRQGAELHAANGLDPAAFDAAWKGFTEGKLSEVPAQFRERSRQTMAALGVQHRNQIVMSQAAEAKRDAAVSWTTQTQALQNDVLSLVQAGQMKDPAYMERLAAFSGHLADGVATGIITQEQATLRSRQIADESEAFGVASIAEAAYRKAGRGPAGMAAAERLIEDTIVKNPDSSLTPERKSALSSAMLGRVRDLEADRRVEVQDASAKADADIDRLRLGINVDLATLDAHRRRLLNAGEPQAAQRIGQMMEVSQEIRGLGQQPIPAIAARIRELDGKRDRGTATAAEGEMLQQAVRVRDRKAKALTDDAFSYGTTVHEKLVGKPAPLNWNDPATLQTAIGERMRQARVISEREGVPVAPFTTPEIAEIVGRAEALKPDRRAQLDWLGRVTADLGDDRAAGVVLDKFKDTDMARDVPALRQILDVYARGNRSAARTLWDQYNTDPKDLKIEKPVRDRIAEDVARKFNETVGGVYRMQASVAMDENYGRRLDTELATAIRIGIVRAARQNETSGDGGTVAELYGHRLGIAERGFAAVTFPADTDAGMFEAGLRALRQPAVDAFVNAISDPLDRMKFARAGQNATWIDRGDGYELLFSGSAMPVLSPVTGQPLRWSLAQILEAGRPALADQRARATAPAAAVDTGRQGIGGVVGADDPLAAMGAAAAADRQRRGEK